MSLNKQKGNMYPWVTATWNPIKGCEHDCSYCYVKRLNKRYGYDLSPRLVEKELKTNLGKRKVIFIGSTSDMFGRWVPDEWINKVLHTCNNYPKNRYLFQSKNPQRFHDFLKQFPPNTLLGTTIETDRDYEKYLGGNAPSPYERADAMGLITLPKMVSIEPIMKFNLENLIYFIKRVDPTFVSIGADSNPNQKLHSEPSADELERLIDALWELTDVRIKPNLLRLLKNDAAGGGPDDMKKTNTKGNFEGPVANTTKWTCDKCGSHRHFGGMCIDCGKINKKTI